MDYSATDIAKALNSGIDSLVASLQSEDFSNYLAYKGIDSVTDANEPRYWESFAGFIMRQVHERLEHDQLDKSSDLLALHVQELYAAFPNFMYDQHRLSKAENHHRHPNHHDLETASQFNDLVRNFASQFPATRPSDLEHALMRVADSTIHSEHLKETADFHLKGTLRGVRHELGFAQIVDATGRSITPGSVARDLRGVDFVVQGLHRELGVDVKASMIRPHGRDSQPVPYMVRDDNITMYSTLIDDDFGDSFFISQALAVKKAPFMDGQLHAAEDEQYRLLQHAQRQYYHHHHYGYNR